MRQPRPAARYLRRMASGDGGGRLECWRRCVAVRRRAVILGQRDSWSKLTVADVLQEPHSRGV
jgi:hypothetical protein